jgi:hypothetical protein
MPEEVAPPSGRVVQRHDRPLHEKLPGKAASTRQRVTCGLHRAYCPAICRRRGEAFAFAT